MSKLHNWITYDIIQVDHMIGSCGDDITSNLVQKSGKFFVELDYSNFLKLFAHS